MLTITVVFCCSLVQHIEDYRSHKMVRCVCQSPYIYHIIRTKYNTSPALIEFNHNQYQIAENIGRHYNLEEKSLANGLKI